MDHQTEFESREDQYKKNKKKLQSESEQLTQELNAFKRALNHLYENTQASIADYPEIKRQFSQQLSRLQQEGCTLERTQQRKIQEKIEIEEQTFKKDKKRLLGE